MKAAPYNRIKTLVAIKDDFSDRVFPPGTEGTVVECYTNPQEGYAVDLAVPDERFVTGFAYGNVILFPNQFEVMDEK